MVDARARLLILGSFPSVQSLAVHQYYANPRNAFWPITSALFGFDETAPYEARLAALRSHGVALWDVLHRCHRVGSADAKIDTKTLVPNDFAMLFAEYPTIAQVVFNGAAAARLFGRLVPIDRPIRLHRLPSASPARAMRPTDKLAAWRAVMPS